MSKKKQVKIVFNDGHHIKLKKAKSFAYEDGMFEAHNKDGLFIVPINQIDYVKVKK